MNKNAKFLRQFLCALALMMLATDAATIGPGPANADSGSPPPDQDLREPERKAPDPFIVAVASIRPGVLAVGSYDFKDKPTARYFGTGFVMGDGNTLATNAHVIDAIRKENKLKHLAVFLPDTRPRQGGRRAIVFAQDQLHDVALLRFNGAALEPLQLDAKTVPRQGQAVGVLGYPIGMVLGVVPAAHKGVVSAVVPAVRPLPVGIKLTPELTQAIKHRYEIYQLDLNVFPGNSGSPLFDVHSGKVMGIINKTLAARTREHLLTNPSGIAYAVPVRWLDQLLIRSRASGNRTSSKGLNPVASSAAVQPS